MLLAREAAKPTKQRTATATKSYLAQHGSSAPVQKLSFWLLMPINYLRILSNNYFILKSALGLSQLAISIYPYFLLSPHVV